MIAVPNLRPERPVVGRAQCVAVMLGSNIAPEYHLPAAVQHLRRLGRIAAVSSVWQTAPIGDTAQADFCNAALLLETDLDIAELLRHLRDIESQLGRVRDPRNKNAARTIDLDLAIIPGSPRTLGQKTFPDPEIAERVFLAVPLDELLPDYRLPNGRALGMVANELRQRDAVDLRLSLRSDIALA